MDARIITYFQKIFAKIDYRTPLFYGTPKVHKGKQEDGSYRNRPVVSTSGSFNKVASRYIDYYLQKLIPNLPTYLKDSFGLLSDLKSIALRKNTRVSIITADAVGMYTNICK